MINVNWFHARAHAAWLSAVTGDEYRLASEAEWEYAALAGSTDRYPPDSGERVRQGRDALRRGRFYVYRSVGSFPANAWGFHDMQGNVREWTLDCWKKDYGETPVDGSAQFTGDCNARVLKRERTSATPATAAPLQPEVES